MKISVRANLFAAAAVAQSTEQARFYLNGVQVERCPQGGVFLVATDGHRMLVGHDAAGELQHDAAVILKAPKSILAAAAKASGDARLTFDGQLMDCAGSVAKADSASTCGIIDGHFPEWSRVLPNLAQPIANKPMSFNGDYLGDFGKVARMLTRKDGVKGSGTARFDIHVFGDARGPALITFTEGVPLFGVLMPFPLVNGYPETRLPFAVNTRAPESENAA